MEGLLKSLDSTHEYLKKSESILGDAFHDVRSQQALHWINRFKNAKLSDVSEATALLEKIQSGPWGDETTKLLGAVTNIPVADSSNKTPPRGKQTCVNFQAYVTPAEKAQLQSNVSSLMKIDLLSTRMVNIGLLNPSEPCYGHISQYLSFV